MQRHSQTALERNLLLPPACRMWGWALAALGMAGAVLRFGRGWQPEFLQGKAFALVSVYFRARYFTVINNNFTEEICGILLLAGLALIAFSRERIETPDLDALRYRAMLFALYVNTLLLATSFFLVFGLAFAGVMAVNLYTPLIFYIIFRSVLVRRKGAKKAA